MTEYAMNLALQIYFNPSFSKVLFFEEYKTDDIRNVIAQLNHIRLSTAFIDSIYLYNHLNQVFVVSSSRTSSLLQPRHSFDDQYIDGVINDVVFHEENSIYNGKALFIPRDLSPGDEGVEQRHTVYSLVYKNAFTSTDLPSVVINISPQWFEDILFKNINRSESNDLTDIFAIDNKNRVVMQNRHYDIMQDVGQEEWFGIMEDSDVLSGYLVSDIEGDPKLINYYRSHNLEIDWMFVSIKPYSSITREIHKLRNYIAFFSFLLLLVAILIEAIVSNRIYRPIRRLLNTLETSQVGRDDYKVTLKNNFFRIYLQQRIPLERDELTEEFQKFQINLNTQQKFLMILIRIDNYIEISKNLSFRSLSLLKFQILNELSGHLAVGFPSHEVAVLPGRFMLLACNLLRDEESDSNAILGVVRSMKQSASDTQGVEFSFIHSAAESGFENMPAIYEEMMNAARKTAYLGRNVDLSLNEFAERERSKYVYPAKEVGLLVDSLKRGDSLDLVKQIYDGIVDNAGNHSHRALNFSITNILLKVNELIYFLRTYGGFEIEFDIEGILDDLEHLDNYEALDQQFSAIFQEIIKHQQKASNKSTALVEMVADIVGENYGNPLFSMVEIAATLHLTPGYLGRLYKKSTMQSLNDYITQIRIEKSKEVLRNSSKSINEIALASGFSTANYYHTVFKKKTGMTPQKFRNTYEG